MRKTVKHHPMKHLRSAGMRTVGIFALCLAGVLVLWAQNSQPTPQPKAAVPQNPQSSPNILPPIQLDSAAALHHLNQIISWYRHATTGIQSVGLPSDAIYQDNSQTLGAQAVRLPLRPAKAESQLTKAEQKISGPSATSTETTLQQNLAQMQARTSSQIDALQSQIDDLNTQIEKLPAAKRGDLISHRDALKSQLELQKALLDAVQKMATFVETNGEISSGLEGGINQLARSIPEVPGSSTAMQKTSTAPAPAKPSLANSGGLISQAMTLYD